MIAGLALFADPASARECRASETIPGVRGALQQGCKPKAVSAPRPQDEALRGGRNPGFVDLGNGVEIRIGGRVRADAVLRR
jgi:hypothetical protein